MREVFERADRGESPRAIAKALHAAGYRTRQGKPWTRRRVYDTLTNRLYRGQVVWKPGTPEEEVREADPAYVTALVEPAVFERVQKQLARRNPSPQHERRGGRPPLRYPLASLARCASCGEPMYPRTSTHVRRDSTRSGASATACPGPRTRLGCPRSGK